MSRWGKSIAAVAVIGGIGYGAFHWWTVARFMESTDDAYIHGDVTQISSEMAGNVVELLVGDNQSVETGALLARIDDAGLKARVVAADRNMTSQNAAMATLIEKITLQTSLIESAAAELAGAKAGLALTRQELDRAQTLIKTNTGSRQRLDNALADTAKAEAAERRTRANLAAAQQEKNVLRATQGERDAAIAQAQALLALTQVDLRHATILAPIAGIVGNRAVRLGQYVRPGTALLSLIPETVWVEANFKETQLRALNVGRSARVSVDAFPDHPLIGRVASFSPASGAVFSLLPSENATGNFTKVVQRIPVRIALPAVSPLKGLLRPGMSVTVTVDTR